MEVGQCAPVENSEVNSEQSSEFGVNVEKWVVGQIAPERNEGKEHLKGFKVMAFAVIIFKRLTERVLHLFCYHNSNGQNLQRTVQEPDRSSAAYINGWTKLKRKEMCSLPKRVEMFGASC